MPDGLPTRTPAPAPGALSAPTPAPGAAAEEAPAGDRPDPDYSPIFASLRSEWFVKSDEAPEPSKWESPGDAGWRRAAELSNAQTETPTSSDGLPTRTPGRNLIAGSADDAKTTEPVSVPVRDPRRNGGLSGFQQGVSRARTLRPVEPRESYEESPTPTEEAAQ